jgi:uncharacterized membrane protein
VITNLLLAGGLGLFAGAGPFTALFWASLAARLGWLDATQCPLAFFGATWVVVGCAGLAVAELFFPRFVVWRDRDRRVRLVVRVVSGAVAGALVGASGGVFLAGAAAGALGAIGGLHAARWGFDCVAAYFRDARPAWIFQGFLTFWGAFAILVRVALGGGRRWHTVCLGVRRAFAHGVVVGFDLHGVALGFGSHGGALKRLMIDHFAVTRLGSPISRMASTIARSFSNPRPRTIHPGAPLFLM